MTDVLCPTCGQRNLTRADDLAFPFEVRKRTVTVHAAGLLCEGCGFATVLGSAVPGLQRKIAEQYRTEVGLVTASEIRKFRDQHKWSQERLAAEMGVGIASLKRWEAGSVQTRAMDRVIRRALDRLASPEVVALTDELTRGLLRSAEPEFHAMAVTNTTVDAPNAVPFALDCGQANLGLAA